MFSPRVKNGAYVLEGINAFATMLYFSYLFFHMRAQFGFTNLGNLTMAAVNGGVYASVVWLAGRFAQRRGYFTALKLGFAMMTAAMVIASVAGTVVGCFGAMVLWTVGISFTWPCLEAIVSEHEPRDQLPKRLGVYNVIWAATGGAATLVGGWLMQQVGPRSTFLIPAALHVAQYWLAARLERLGTTAPVLPVVAAAEPAAGSMDQTPASPEWAKKFMKMAWIANPFAYMAINALIPVIPQRAADLHLGLAAAGAFTSVWMLARTGAFVVLWLWPGWHYRFRFLIGSYLTMAVCFVLVLLSRHLWLLVAAQLGFGFGVGLAYYSSLFYSMDVGDTKGEHGGLHEAALGAGICAGPAIGAVSLRFFPESPNTNTWAVAGLLTVGMAVLYVLRYRPVQQRG